ncbi:hypothetical protein SORBI_3010G099300 [Sorghum bicolor]|uniref:Uncharacterized protein n=1 Tax=Sorghum bicolor TaxID=4558 RepID=A0A1W0VS74_SORBI|nr:hypothetical protein SORBI_3010G099300 [Sorghum bicolor]
MSLCCCSAATGRGVLLPSLLLGRRHRLRHPLVNLRTIATFASSSSAAATTSSLSPPQQRQVTIYVDTLLEWNQRMNLTAVTDEAEVMTRHVADSLAMLPPLERAYRGRSTSAGGSIDGVSLIDVGSGAGLPGLILAVARPSWKFTLLESMRKRCTFLEHAVEAMELSNVNVVCDRAEEEVRNAEGAVRKLGGSMLELCDVESMGPHGQRTAVIYVKEHATPKKYPRLPGTPSKMPL